MIVVKSVENIKTKAPASQKKKKKRNVGTQKIIAEEKKNIIGHFWKLDIFVASIKRSFGLCQKTLYLMQRERT